MSDLAFNTRLVVDHFESFVNRKDVEAIDRNMWPDFVDHDGPGGRIVDPETDRAMMKKMHELFPDLHVGVKNAVAENDMVVVLNLWTGTNAITAQRIEFHGFVMWRIAKGKFAEQWATVTPMQEITAEVLNWC